MLVMLLGQSRVFYSMANDGLLPKLFAEVHPKFRTPYKCNAVLFVFVGAVRGFLPGDHRWEPDLHRHAVRVCSGVHRRLDYARAKTPNQPRPFRTPLVPLVPILGMVVCGSMIIGLDSTTQLAALVWMLIGLCVYFLYAKGHSNLDEPEMTGSVQPQAGD